MFILKIKEIFFPSTISDRDYGSFHMILPYIGFRLEVIKEVGLDKKEEMNSCFLGTEHVIIEKSNGVSASFHKGDIVSVSSQFLTQGLGRLSLKEWIKDPKILINNANISIMKPSVLDKANDAERIWFRELEDLGNGKIFVCDTVHDKSGMMVEEFELIRSDEEDLFKSRDFPDSLFD